MIKKVIYNCHNHIFTHENIPNRYYPFFVVPALRNRFLRGIVKGVLKICIPWSKKDKPHRISAFLKAAYRKNQEGNLRHLIGYYPSGTKFVILPMDMSFMKCGKVKESIDEQHRELARLSKDSKYKDLLIPFAHIDPRRKDSLTRLYSLVENDNFKGVKIYPPLGYKPTDSLLMNEIYPYMVSKNIPLMVHCSPGSVYTKKLKKTDAHALADPDNYKAVMDSFPDLRICLGHFGGTEEWSKHINEIRNIEDPSWLEKILDIMQSKKYPNLYADISYTIFNFQENIAFLNILMEDNIVKHKILFGSDFYMTENEKYSEKRLSIDLRYALGEDNFWKIANENPKKYLGGY